MKRLKKSTSNLPASLPMIESRIGFRTLVRREVVRYFVVWTQTLVPPLISTALFIFVFGFSIGKNLQVAIHGVRYLDFLVPGLVSMHLIESAYTNSSSSLFMSRWHNMIQEVLLSPLSYFEMVLALLLGSLSRALIVSAGVWGISLLFTHFQFQHPWVRHLRLDSSCGRHGGADPRAPLRFS